MAPPPPPIVLPTPESPRSSQSPPPPGPQGDLEAELFGLANSLYNLATTVANDSTKDPGSGKQVGVRVNDVTSHIAAVDEMAQGIQTMIPLQVLADIDNSKNPMMLTKDRLERAATENQFMNAKIAAITVRSTRFSRINKSNVRVVQSYRNLLNEALVQTFPDLEAVLHPATTADGIKEEAHSP